jgi:hypothetical protein
MHVRNSYAAVSYETTSPHADARAKQAHIDGRPQSTRILWAHRPLHVDGGYLVGVRMHEDQLQVGFVSSDTGFVKRVRPESVMSERAADRWIRSSRFHIQCDS